MPDTIHTFQVPPPGAKRLDLFLTQECPNLSRSQIQTLIKAGHITRNGQSAKPKDALEAGDAITLHLPEEKPDGPPQPQDLPLQILHEDPDLLVLDKASGMVVHPAEGHADGTLVNALLHHTNGQLAPSADPRRPGIVHRLDRDTSGVLVVAKTPTSLQSLQDQFAQRETFKLYLAATQSPPREAHQSVFTHIGRHPVHRQRMAVVNPGSGRPAITDVHHLHTRPDETALLLCALHTGRTHQIRVHLTHLGHPILGDPIYARPSRQPGPPQRLMLHAWRLGLTHPTSGQWLEFEAPLPDLFQPWSQPIAPTLQTIRDRPTPRDHDFLHTLHPTP